MILDRVPCRHRGKLGGQIHHGGVVKSHVTFLVLSSCRQFSSVGESLANRVQLVWRKRLVRSSFHETRPMFSHFKIIALNVARYAAYYKLESIR